MRSVRITISVSVVFLFLSSTICTGISFSNSLDEYPTVLVTGFEPFGSYDINPSQLIVETLDGQEIGGAQIIGICLPVDFNDSVYELIEAIDDFNPEVVISIGLAGGRHLISIEKLGINLKRDPYDEENKSIFHRLNPSGPFFQQSSIPVRTIVKKLRREGIPVRQSWFAGTYVCNALLYNLLRHIYENELSIKAGFIHVPLLSSQDPKGMDFDMMVKAVNLAILESL